MLSFLLGWLLEPTAEGGLGDNSLEEYRTAGDYAKQQEEKRAEKIDDSWCG